MTADIRPQPKPVRELDPDYLDFVRSKPCCLVRFPEHNCILMTFPRTNTVDPHHVSPRNGTKGIGSKVSDRRAVPVCRNAHRYCEQHPQEVLPFLNEVIRKLNREYDATHPKKEKRERKPSVRVGLGVKHCPACGREHFYPTQDFRTVTGYRCKSRNVWINLYEETAKVR